ncbi:flagellar biosynthesis protein FlhB [Thermopetrobacter sp. TC1]|uniref:flagellar biosynthesis protein FlhB n=1 Tax=Thermopetrobacter sp. TC1 TaxID=1495045 RepID=UPI00056E858C|nr:flagellar biosynthesis protein FlhB [Thermopetrobacter sp. TC1]
MAEEPDKDSKTEDPTEKRIADAIEKGNVPFSREPAVLASILAMLVVAAFFIGPGSPKLAQSLAAFLERPGEWRLDAGEDAFRLIGHVAGIAFLFLLPLFLAFIIAGISASLIQNPPRIAFKRIQPELSRISPKKGMKRIFGAQGWVEFAKALAKFAAVSGVVAMLLRTQSGWILLSLQAAPQALPEILLKLAMDLLAAVAVAALVLAAADFAWSRRYWWLNLRMTRQEVKDERKDLEGDPIVKARRLSLARDRLRRSMMAAVPQATVVITNPTHYAVALRYEREKDAAPVVVAKGQNLIAQKIREIAQEHDVPIVENKALARALYAQVEINQMIPPEFYAAVAEIIHYVMTRTRQAISGA